MNSKPEGRKDVSKLCRLTAIVKPAFGWLQQEKYIRNWLTRETSVWLSVVTKRSECKLRCV